MKKLLVIILLCSAVCAAEKTALTFISSKTSKIYHRSDCRSAAIISAKNAVQHESAEAAEKSGKTLCKACAYRAANAAKGGK